MDPKIPTPQDAQMQLESSVTQTASYNSPSFDFGSGFSPNLAGIPVAIVAFLYSLATGGGQTYSHKLQQSADNATWVDAGVSAPITATGTCMCAGLVTMRYVRRAVTMAGGSPSMTSDSYVNRNLGQL